MTQSGDPLENAIAERANGILGIVNSKSFLPAVSNYIANQKEHHKKQSFDDEIREILEKSCIEYDERYILKGVTIPMSD